MPRANSLLGLVGVILLLFAAAAFAFTRAARSVDMIYIAAHAGFGLLALVAYLSSGLDNLRTFVGERSTRYGANAILYSVIFIAVLGLLNYVGARRHHRFDLTEASVYSLSPQSMQVVQHLEEKLELLAFVEGGINPALHDLLDSYGYASDKVSFRMVDPDRDPVAAEQYKIRSYNSVHLQYGEESTVVTEPTEENVTNAIIKVSRGVKKIVCFIEGHGEPDIADEQTPRGFAVAAEALANENYETKKVLLMTLENVPEECSVAAVIGPEKPLVENEVQALENFLRNGGSLLVLLPPRTGERLVPLLARWGAQVHDDIVVDQVVQLFQGPQLGLQPLVNTYGAHEITQGFNQLTIFPRARSITADAVGTPGVHATELAKTSANSWAETDLETLFANGTASLDPNDQKGPVSIGVAASADLTQMGGAPGEDKESRLVVFGSVEFANNRNIGGSFYNQDLFLNAVGWLAGETDLLSIRPRNLRASRVTFTPEQGTVIFYLSVLLLPEALLLIGIAVWWRRSNA